MSKLTWDAEGERLYETGIKECALFVMGSSGYGKGEAWNGITGITESPSGAETTSLYANNTKYLNLLSVEELSGTINAYMYPESWGKCDGSAELIKGVSVGQQARQSFGLAYKTNIGNDTEGSDYGYKLHLIYGAKASPSERAYSTINDSPEAQELSWEFKTTPVAVTKVPGIKPTSIITINSKEIDAEKLAILESKIYGTESTEATLPTPDEVFELLSAQG